MIIIRIFGQKSKISQLKFYTLRQLNQFYTLESAYGNNDQNVNVLIAGSLYIVDFQQSCQYKQNAHSRKRKIKREVIKDVNSKKGIAGIPTEPEDDLPDIARYDYF